MAKTVIGMFDSTAAAQSAARQLISSGIQREDIGITSNDYMTDDGDDIGSSTRSRDADAGTGVGDTISNFFSSLFGGRNADNARYYSDAVQRGGTVVTVDAETDEMADRAAAIMDQYGASDVDARGAQYATSSNYSQSDATASQATASMSTQERDLSRANLTDRGEAVIPVMEEELQVGKREVERGGVRVRSHVIERPVEEVVRLREERVRVERRPVNRLITDADMQAFREGAIEVTEMAEVPVISKQARVVEEVVVGKNVEEHTETVRDTVRRTDVEVDEIRPDAQKGTRGKGSGR